MTNRWIWVLATALVLLVASLADQMGPALSAAAQFISMLEPYVTGVIDRTAPAVAAAVDSVSSVSAIYVGAAVAGAILLLTMIAWLFRVAHRPRRRIRVLARRGRSVTEIARRTHLSRDAVRTSLELRGKPFAWPAERIAATAVDARSQR